ncbi:MAG: hypothetical protein QOH03_753, partial [Kribbellaceae bacterium]|nr:hypothetical protein [Kribbellaceae bacterium]
MRLRPSSLPRLVLLGALALTTALTAAPVATAAPAADQALKPTCFDSGTAGTVEEQRLGRGVAGGPSVPAEILARSGFDRQVALFSKLLCAVPNRAAATALVRVQGEALWRTATYRAQHPQTAPALPSTDDRGLYWAR